MKFKNRLDAAQRLVDRLLIYAGPDTVVLAIPRGAAPLAQVISQALGCPAGIVYVKKIGAPLNPEFAIGAVCGDGTVFVAETGVEISSKYISEATRKLRWELYRKQKAYGFILTPEFVAQKNVLIVDDGIATGVTLAAAARMVKKLGARKVIGVSPVLSMNARDLVELECDSIVSLLMPENFRCVADYFEEFSQVTDAEVVEMLRVTNRGRHRPSLGSKKAPFESSQKG